MGAVRLEFDVRELEGEFWSGCLEGTAGEQGEGEGGHSYPKVGAYPLTLPGYSTSVCT